MSGYSTPLQVYYCKQTESPGDSHRIAPSPQITINPEIYYANDSVIGYTYNITLNGYANALRKENNAGSINYGLSGVIEHIGDIREIFNTNGGNLYIQQNNQNILVAKGATIKNIQFNQSENKWINYSPFTIELEFNEVDFIGCDANSSISCASSIFHQQINAVTSDNLIDIKKYKIKEFKDSWSFTIDEQIYDNFGGIDNNIFKVQYDLSATGKNYYINDNLVPAWQQARLFVQDKLYKQIFGLINGTLQIESQNMDSCLATRDISSIHNTDIISPRSGGLFDGFNTTIDENPVYGVYNETINCSSSESEGTFGVVYTAIFKKYDPNISPLANSIIHSYNKNMTINTENKIDANIVIQGKVQGLVRGGFIHNSNDFSLPASGTFINVINGSETKYENALNYYSTKVGSKTDLLDDHKNLLNVTKNQLLIKGNNDTVIPSNFTLDHNYHEGSISYNATYSRSLALSLDKGFANISITRQDPVDIVQEFIIPGRINGPIIQKLNMKTARVVSVTIEGANPANTGCFIDDICSLMPQFSISNYDILIGENTNWIKTKEDYTMNKLDGSYSILLEYTMRSC